MTVQFLARLATPRVLAALLALHFASWPAASAAQPAPSRPATRNPQVVAARGMVASAHPLASRAGLEMLQAGGNAVDAAVAAAAVMTIVEPCSNGLGSDAFCILWDGQQLHGLNASGTAPAAWTPEYFRRKHGDGAATPPASAARA